MIYADKTNAAQVHIFPAYQILVVIALNISYV